MRKLLVLGLVAAGLLAGCGPTQEELYVAEPATDKTIMVPPGLSPTVKIVKKVFSEAGWKTFVTGASIETAGSGGKYVNVNTKAKYPARYAAWVSGNQYDLCLTFKPAISYDISIVDNVTGEEVAAFNGRACSDDLEDKIKETLAPLL